MIIVRVAPDDRVNRIQRDGCVLQMVNDVFRDIDHCA